MASEAPADATWKAVSTLEWKRNRKKPVAAKGVGAILGEAADVVGKWAQVGPGALGPSSPYLNRLSEIQIQDESYIHQQLVKPEEVKPKRQAHRLVLTKGARSGRGLKVSLSRKVRFNEAEGSPTSKAAAAAAAATKGSGTAAALSGSAESIARAKAGFVAATAADTVQPSSTSSSVPALPDSKPAKRAAVGFADEGGNNQSSSSSGSRRGHSGSPEAAGHNKDTPGAAAAAQSSSSHGNQPAGSSPVSVAPTQQQQEQAHRTAAGAGPSSMQPQQPAAGQHKHSGIMNNNNSSTSSSTFASTSQSHTAASTASTADSAIMDRFLQQQQPSSAAETPRISTGLQCSRSGSPDLSMLHLTGWQGSRAAATAAAAAGAGPHKPRRTTDLVDKQLQWLRGSTSAPNSSSNTGSNTGSSGSQGTVHSAGSALQQAGQAGNSSQPFQEFTATLGYRPIGIPQELFDRWSNMGSSTKQQPTAGAAAAPAPAAASTTGASPNPVGPSSAPRPSSDGPNTGSRYGSSSTRAAAPGHHGRSSSSLDLAPAAQQGSCSPGCSRPGSGSEHQHAGSAGDTVMARQAAAAGGGDGGGGSWQREGRHHVSPAPPARRLSASNVLEGRSAAAELAATHSRPHRQQTADSSTLSSLAAALRPPAPAVTPAAADITPLRAGGVAAPVSTQRAYSPTPSLPPSGRSSLALEHNSPMGYQGPGGGSSSTWQHAPGTSDRRTARRTDGVTGSSSSSSYGDETSSSSRDVQVGRSSPLRPASMAPSQGSATHNKVSAAGVATAVAAGNSQRPSRSAMQGEASVSGYGGGVGLGQQRMGSPLGQPQWQELGQQAAAAAGSTQIVTSSSSRPIPGVAHPDRVHLPDIVGVKAPGQPQSYSSSRQHL